MGRALLWTCAAVIAATSLWGCGREDPSSSAPSEASNLPAVPTWAKPMIGTVSAPAFMQSKACLGHFDAVTKIYTGDHPGYDVGGWAWDAEAGAPASRVIFVNADARIVGAGEGGVPRPDVPKVLPKVTSGVTGWHGLVAAKGGKITALAILKSGKQCDAGSLQMPGD